MATEFLASLASNPYFSAGFGLFGVGTVATAGRALGVVGVAALRRHWVTTVEVPCNDKAYSWLLEWVAREAAHASLHVSVRTQWEEEEGGRVSAKYLVEPSPGTHVFRWKGAWVRLERSREQQQVDVIGGVPWEVVTLTTLGRRRPLLLGMLEEARRDVIARHSGLTLTYGSSGSGWRELGPPQAARPLDTVVVEEGLAERLAADCEKFLRLQKSSVAPTVSQGRSLVQAEGRSSQTRDLTARAARLWEDQPDHSSRRTPRPRHIKSQLGGPRHDGRSIASPGGGLASQYHPPPRGYRCRLPQQGVLICFDHRTRRHLSGSVYIMAHHFPPFSLMSALERSP